MDTLKKNLKSTSKLILFLLGLTVIRLVLDAAFGGLAVDKVPEGFTAEIYQVVLLISLVLSFLLCLPDLYMGIKGLKIAEKPDDSCAHIVWAKILFVITVIAVVSSLISLFNATDITMEILEFVNVVLSAIAYFIYIKAATDLRNAVVAKE